MWKPVENFSSPYCDWISGVSTPVEKPVEN